MKIINKILLIIGTNNIINIFLKDYITNFDE